MAKGKKTGGRDFEVGHPGGPGQPKLDPEVKRIRKYTSEELEQLVSTLLTATDGEIDAIRKDPAAPKIKKIIASSLDRADESGNFLSLDTILNRVIGKVKEKIEHSGLEPSILIKRDGSEVHFALAPKKSEEEE